MTIRGFAVFKKEEADCEPPDRCQQTQCQPRPLTHEGDAIADREQSQQREQDLAERIGRVQAVIERRFGAGSAACRANIAVYASLSSSVRYLGASAFTFSMNAA